MTGLQILTGDCREVLPMLEAGSVQCCITSPPYWGLRDYGTAQWEGGDAECDHKKSLEEFNSRGKSTLTTASGFKNNNHSQEGWKRVCGHCGARRIDSQLGLESTPEEYIANMVAVFREVWRVLRDDGTLWLNLGDSYAGGNSTGNNPSAKSTLTTNNGKGPKIGDKYSFENEGSKSNRISGLKPKDLVGIPWRLALALQADGWYLRSDIIWHKPNPMPESVTDRPTKAHEYIFLLTKQERYFYDAEAIREAGSRENNGGTFGSQKGKNWIIPEGDPNFRNGSEQWGRTVNNSEFRNKRSVWTIATQPYAEAHFATFPEEIPKVCIMAGSKPGDVILDPFAGSGTTGKVALELGRCAILIELNPAYIELARERTLVTPGFF